ncbi:protein VAC14 homolog [Hyalella azteca]|uniref:Protein VAC14 homolog n=1 Tax=Hyalella azteca TaxID=294128 RepID=A0A8B7NLU9_HYAAZ|nr:protein VAC14 homolog [Hyalella azteca]
MTDMVTPIVGCLTDQNANVRYAAAESLYNVVRVARQHIFLVFEELFSALTVLITDPDNHVRVGAGMLDTTMKEVLKECSCSLELCLLIAVIRPKLTTTNCTVQVLLVSWLSLLQSIPSLELVPVLTEILDPLMNILSSKHSEVIKEADALLVSLLESCHHDAEAVDSLSLTPVLLQHAQSDNLSAQYMSLSWLNELLALGGRSLLPYAAPILAASLPCIEEASSSNKTKDVAKKVSGKVMTLLVAEDDDQTTGGANKAVTEAPVDLQSIVVELLKHLRGDHDECKFLILRWLGYLMQLFPSMMQGELERICRALLPVLRDRSDVVVSRVLVLMSTLAVAPKGDLPLESGDSPPHLDHVLELLMEAFGSDRQLLDERGQLILRQLCVLLSPTQVFVRISKLLQKGIKTQNADFHNMMAHTMATILITSKELFPMRLQLRKLETKEWCDVFESLFKCWCHNPFSVILLCLLSQNYEQSAQLVALLGDGEVTVDFLVEVDKLVQLLESPIFTYLRLDLLKGDDSSDALLETLYGLLMILPQSSSYTKLATRLSNLPSPQLKKPTLRRPPNQIDFDELIKYFKSLHEKKREDKLVALVAELRSLANNGDLLQEQQGHSLAS